MGPRLPSGIKFNRRHGTLFYLGHTLGHLFIVLRLAPESRRSYCPSSHANASSSSVWPRSAAKAVKGAHVGRGLYLLNQTGTVHVEGLRIGGRGLTEGIDRFAQGETV